MGSPAYAGKSFAVEVPQYCVTGSPPPMRGKVISHRNYTSFTRITPAYAGKRKHAVDERHLR